MTDAPGRWKRMRFKQNKVWVAVDEKDLPILENGKARMKYRLDQETHYQVHSKNLFPDTGEEKIMPVIPVVKFDSPPEMTEISDHPVITIYTDGASSGNPGPSGIGIVMEYNGQKKEISRYIGISTNNIAELEAIRTALTMIRKHHVPVRLFTDSAYAVGLLQKGWKPHKNQELVRDIIKIVSLFRDIRIIKVSGHSGLPGNELADRLATSGIKNKAA